MGEFVGCAEALRHLSNNFVVNVQDYRIAGGFDPQHCISKKITSDAGHDILGPRTAVRALSVPAIYELAASVISEYDVLFVFITDDARLGIAKYAATGEC